MNPLFRFAAIAAITGVALTASVARAEKADRDKPVNIEADRVSVDDVKRVQTFEGKVQLVKGTLIIRAERIVVTQDDDGYQRGVATGSGSVLPRFRQKREGQDEHIEGEAERIEYNTNSEIAELFHRAWVKSGEDQVRGDYIWYDAVNEKYLVTAGEARDPKAPPPRVRAVIQPKNKDTEPERPAVRGERLQLKGAGGLATEPAQQ